MKYAFLIILSIALGWTAFWRAGVTAEFNYAVLMIAMVAFALLLRPQAPPLAPYLSWPLAVLVVWVALQVVPLPAAALAWVSPARVELARAAGSAWAPMTVDVAASFREMLRLFASVLVFLAVRELAWRFSENRTPWVLTLPVVLLALLEAGLGLAQASAGVDAVSGTYVNRNHYAGLIEMTLALPMLFAFAALGGERLRRRSPLRPALWACAGFGSGALLLAGGIWSLSRAGFALAVFSAGAAVLAGLTLGSRVARWAWLGAIPGAVAAFLFLAPSPLIGRFVSISADDRSAFVRETLGLIAAYPVAGCGVGGYESAFLRFKTALPHATVDYAHNDYVQSAAELGVPAFLAGLMFIAGVLAGAARALGRHASLSGAAFASACLIGMASLLLHSWLDFNSYIPANALVFAWVAALGTSAMFSSRPVTASSVIVLEAKARTV